MLSVVSNAGRRQPQDCSCCAATYPAPIMHFAAFFVNFFVAAHKISGRSSLCLFRTDRLACMHGCHTAPWVVASGDSFPCTASGPLPHDRRPGSKGSSHSVCLRLPLSRLVNEVLTIDGGYWFPGAAELRPDACAHCPMLLHRLTMRRATRAHSALSSPGIAFMTLPCRLDFQKC